MKTKFFSILTVCACITMLCIRCNPPYVEVRSGAYFYSQDAVIKIYDPIANDTLVHRLTKESPAYKYGLFGYYDRQKTGKNMYEDCAYIIVSHAEGEAPLYLSTYSTLKINDSDSEYWNYDGKYSVAEKIEMMKKEGIILEITDQLPHKIDLLVDFPTGYTISTP